MKNTRGGFTVVELLIAIAVMGMVIPTLASLVTNVSRLNDRARDLAVINALAENKAESLRSISYVGVSNGTYDFTNELPATISKPNQASYTVTSASPSLKQIDVEISVTTYGEEQTISYRTYLGELGVGQY